MNHSHLMKRSTACIALSLALLNGAAASAEAAQWPGFLGPHRNGVYAADDIAAIWPAEGPKVVWKRPIGQGFAGPAVADGRVILFHRVDDKEQVEAIDAQTGKTLWTSAYPATYQDDFGFDEGPRATPTIADGRVFTFGAEGVLKAWDFKTGQLLWTVDAQTELKSGKGFFGRVASPLAAGKNIVVNIGGEGAGVVAFDRASGKVAWKATDHDAGYSSPTLAEIHGKSYIFDLTRAGLVALDPDKGTIYFDYPFRSTMDASVNAATPLVIGDRIFLSASYGTGAALLAFDEKGPKKIWAGDGILSNHYATSVEHDGFLYGFDGRQEHGPNLRCVELNTGAIRWSQEQFGAGTVLLAGKNLLILTEKGELISAPASPDGFKPSARAQILGFGVRAYPALAEGFLFARSKDALVCVDLRKK